MISKYTHKELIPKRTMDIVRKIVNGKTETHTHDYFEIEYVVSGSGVYIIDGISYKIEPKMLFYMTPANIHTVISEKTDLITILFKDCSFLQHISDNHSALKLNRNDAILYESLCHELMSNIDNQDYSQQLLQIIISKINLMSGKQYNNICTTSKKALIYILNNFKNNISLSEAAQYVGLSTAYFSSMFKKENNISFKQYVDELRFDYAKKLLSNSDTSISQVCKECGFDNYENFLRRFKLRFGMSPISYRKKGV